MADIANFEINDKAVALPVDKKKTWRFHFRTAWATSDP